MRHRALLIKTRELHLNLRQENVYTSIVDMPPVAPAVSMTVHDALSVLLITKEESNGIHARGAASNSLKRGDNTPDYHGRA